MVLLATCYVGQDCKVGHAPFSFVVLLGVQLKPAFSQCFSHFSDIMVDYMEIPLELQL